MKDQSEHRLALLGLAAVAGVGIALLAANGFEWVAITVLAVFSVAIFWVDV